MTLSLLNNLTKLSNNVFSDYLFAHIDGGGTDTLKLASARSVVGVSIVSLFVVCVVGVSIVSLFVFCVVWISIVSLFVVCVVGVSIVSLFVFSVVGVSIVSLFVVLCSRGIDCISVCFFV